ncbi:MAG: hypothetical protein JNM56_29855 [Planctomycetia bacterium]|nr:hypothetical protein [Planctomycetia bacterium]
MSPTITTTRPLTREIMAGYRPQERRNPQAPAETARAEADHRSKLRPEAGSLERWIDMNA